MNLADTARDMHLSSIKSKRRPTRRAADLLRFASQAADAHVRLPFFCTKLVFHTVFSYSDNTVSHEENDSGRDNLAP
jgi:hypothetical protein